MIEQLFIRILLYGFVPFVIGETICKTHPISGFSIALLYIFIAVWIDTDTKHKYRFRWINEFGKKTNYDIHITPVLTYTKTEVQNEFGNGIAHSISLEWFCWAVSIMRYKLTPVTPQ